jgi:hypothetical protein
VTTHGRRSPVATQAATRIARGGPRRTLTTLLVALLALLGATPALAADDAGVPDPLAPGPYGTQKLEYDAGTLLLNLPTAGQTTTVPMKGSIVHPTGTKGHPSKVIVFVHGRHAVCIGGPTGTTPVPGPAPGQCANGTAPDGTPISTDIRNYGGYDHMSENLASHGYAVMSIEANVTGFDNGFVDRGADARSQIINASLSLLDRWNNGRGPVTDDPSTTVGLKLVGRLELSSGVGLMGHSRGGDAVTDFVTYNRNLRTAWPLAGVVALAPTYFTNRRTPEGTNYASLLPACDGDVSPLHGARLYENAKYAPGNDAVAKVQWYVQGTNHNFFNSVWTGDDFRVAGDPACSRDAASTARLSPTGQRNVGTALMNGFLRRYVGGEKAFDPLMTGEVTLPSAACPATSGKGCDQEVKTSYVGPKAGRLDVLQPKPALDPSTADGTAGPVDPAATTTAATGGPITKTGLTAFEVCRPATTLFPGGPTTPSDYPLCPQVATVPAVPATGTSPAIPAVPGVFNRSWGSQFTVAWNGPASIRAEMGAGGTVAKDVSRFGALTMRVATNRGDARNPVGDDANPASATQDFDVTLVDADGARATTSVARWTTALQPSIGTAYKHVVLNGARIPLSAFSGVDLSRIRTVEFGFGGRTPMGSIQLADVAFQEQAKAAAPTAVEPSVPAPDGPPSAVATLVSTPAQAGTAGTGSAAPSAKAAPGAKACVDASAPRSRVSSLRLTRTGLKVLGRASDRGCSTATGKAVAGRNGGGVQRTVVSVSRRVGTACRFVTRRGTLGAKAACDSPVVLYAKGTTAYGLTLGTTLAKGRYTVTVATYDRAGNLTRAAKRTVRVA